jgi:hypothetical protein
MLCELCGSKNQVRLNAELALTSPKLKTALRNTTLYLIAPARVCFGCGFAQVKIPKSKLKQLRENTDRSFPNT